MKKTKELNFNAGITLVSLVVTIVVMLILVGISVNTVIDGNLFEKAEGATVSIEKTQEKVILNKAIMKIKAENYNSGTTIDELKKELAKEDVEVIKMNNEVFIVLFNNSGRKYKIDNNGNVQDFDEAKLSYFKQKGYYCDTGITANNKYTIVIEVEFINANTMRGYLWGACKSDASTQYHSLQCTSLSGVKYFRVYSNNQKITSEFSPSLNTRYIAKVEPVGSYIQLTINDEIIGSTALGTVANTTYYLGGIHQAGVGPATNQSDNEVLIYSFKIYGADGKTLVCDYVPKIVDNQVVLFDRVRSQVAVWTQITT